MKMFNWKKVICAIIGHTFIYWPCHRCGKPSPWELIRDDKGNAVKDENDSPTYRWKF